MNIKYLSKHFTREEFACKCGCGFSAVDAELLSVLLGVREHYDAPVTITSGCRCEEHNARVGGAKASKHRIGIAADIQVAGAQPEDVTAHLNRVYPDKYGIGQYAKWVHIDVRDRAARWIG